MAAVVLTDWRTTMASHGGTIRPVSHIASNTLETTLSLESQIATSFQKSGDLTLSRRSQTFWSRFLSGALAVLFGLFCVSGLRLEAQSTFGSICGTVQDSSGAAIPDTQITLHSIDENTDRTVTSDATGSYAFENVLASKYSIRARHDGSAETVVDGVTLAARQDLRYTVQMKISAQATTVEVTSSANQINTENGVIGDSKGTDDIGQLPLNFRASTTSHLAALTTSANVQQDSGENIAIGGATSNMVGFSVDGISTANIFNSAAGTNPYPSSEGIAELQVTAYDNNAEFSQVGDVTFTTKPGTNTFHGSLFEYLQNDALDAKVLNFDVKAPKRFNTFGGSSGGPVLIPKLYNGHDKTFFFFDYEGNRRRTSQAEQFLVPTQAERNGNFSGFVTPSNPTPFTNPTTGQPSAVLINPATGQPFPNNTIPTSMLNQSALTLLNNFYPLPNVPNATAASSFNFENLQPIPSNTNGLAD